VHKIGRFIVYDAISVITQNVFNGFAGPLEDQRGGIPPHVLAGIEVRKGLGLLFTPGFSDLPMALFCSNSSRYLSNLLPEKREDKKGLKLVCTFK
jgi:hypothetical protein